MKLIKTHTCFDGEVRFYSHGSIATKTQMNFSVFLPQDVDKVDSAIIWLSGLTCTEKNFIEKSGISAALQGTNTMIICPDTSPRGLNLSGEHQSYDFGSGAGFYVNATSDEYKEHYNMYDYVNDEIYNLLLTDFQVEKEKISIMGHSMGGHGALVIGLRNPDKYLSISAFAPIVNPISAPWGKKAFALYLGDDIASWKQYDATELVKTSHIHSNTILIDQGESDEYLSEQLLTNNLVRACRENKQALEVHMRPGYDHSFYFISTFLQKHIDFHLSKSK